MGSLPSDCFEHNKFFLFSIVFFIVASLNCLPSKANLCNNNSIATPRIPANDISSLQTLALDGYFSLEDINEHAAKDFGNIYHCPPLAIMYPKAVSDISRTIKHVYETGSIELKIAARGHGHSLQGQAQAYQGLVVNMESLEGPDMIVHGGEFPYVDVSAGVLWIKILHETLKHGLAPKSWTDYLHLTVGGTLSNAGISGQAFRHGPQIDNVFQLEVVTGILCYIILSPVKT